MSPRKICIAACFIISLAVLLQGCRDEDLVRPDINSPPETILSVAPAMGDQVFHKYDVRWAGLDRDGVVTQYKLATVAEDELYGGRTSEEDIAEYLVDLPWTFTNATESLFVFRADRPNSRRHSLYVVAIDNEGKEDPTPALTNFTAVDYGLPVIEIKLADNLNPIPRVPGPMGDTLPAYNLIEPADPIRITMLWDGYDPDGTILEWRYKLDSALEVPLPPESTQVSFVYDPMDSLGSDVWLGFHEFKLVAVDDANARSNRATARFVVNFDPNTYVDSIWSYRETTNVPVQGTPAGPPLPEILIFAREWRENPDSAAKYAGMRVGYQFGPLRMKFHGTDKDGAQSGAPPDSFRWSIQGTNMSGGVPPTAACGAGGDIVFYCTGAGRLDTDRALTLFFGAVDNHGKQDGSPDTVKFFVNFPPKILSVTAEVLNPTTGRTRVSWQVEDIDQGYGWSTTELTAAVLMYRYRYRLVGEPQYSQWVYVNSPEGRERLCPTSSEIETLEPGTYELELRAYDGRYLDTRTDTKLIEFTVP